MNPIAELKNGKGDEVEMNAFDELSKKFKIDLFINYLAKSWITQRLITIALATGNLEASRKLFFKMSCLVFVDRAHSSLKFVTLLLKKVTSNQAKKNSNY